ncbi:MAG: hypothetical protein ACO23V_10345 [Chitinophagaceae bacterium]
MNNFFIYQHLDWVKYIPIFFILLIIISFTVGWVYATYRIKNNQIVEFENTLIQSIFGLTALILGFTFSSSTQHFKQREAVVKEISVSVASVYRDVGFLNPKDSNEARILLTNLLQNRINLHKNIDTYDQLDKRIHNIRNEIYELNILILKAIPRASNENRFFYESMLRSKLSVLVNVFSEDLKLLMNHPPPIIQLFLFFQLVIGAMLGGYLYRIQKAADWLLIASYLTLTGLAIYVIFTLEYPSEFMENHLIDNVLVRTLQKLSQH